MKTLRRLLPLLLALCMVATVAAAAPENFNETGYPIVDTPVSVEIAVLQFPTHGRFEEMPIVIKTQELTNVEIKWRAIPASNYGDVTSLMFATNDLPDAFSLGLSSTDILRYGVEGQLVPMNEYIDLYCPNIQALFAARPALLKMCTAPDGNIYSLPLVLEESFQNAADNFFINQVWLDALGLDMPTTTDEFFDVLIAFRDGDPNGNGTADEIPLSFIGIGDGYQAIGSLFASFGPYNDPTNHVAVSEAGEVVYVPAEDYYKEALLFFNRLYSEGLIDQEAFTQDMSQYTAKGTAQQYGAFINWNDFGIVGMDNRQDYSQLLPLKGPEGYQGWRYNYNPTGSLGFFSITEGNEHPEVTMRWIDTLYETDLALEWCFGPEGICTEWVDGEFTWLDIPEGYDLNSWRDKNTICNLGSYLQETSAKFDRSITVVEKRARAEKYEPYLLRDTYFPPCYMDVDDAARLAILATDLNAYVNQSVARMITQGNVEAEWDSFIAQMQGLGVDEYVQIYQRAYDAYMQ